MLENPIFLLGISTFFAAIPIVIWLYILFRKGEKSKKTIVLIFLLGCLTAPSLLGIQYLWDIFPNFNLAAFIEENIQTQASMYIAMFVLFGALEEIIKLYVISAVDKRTVLIKTIGDSIRYSLAAALGFAFTENIYYLFQFWPSLSIGELTGMYIFRSIFTTCAHMIFSGIFGYYYGIGKFSISIKQHEKVTGKSHTFSKIISKLFNLPKSHAYQQKTILKGLFIAILMHVIFNYLLQYNIIIPVIIFVALGFLYLKYLLSRKAGHLILTTDISEKTKSTIAKKDEEVVIELLGMWFNHKRYVDVIQICERLLERDPDNNVVKLFKAKAMDKLDKKSIYKSILGKMLKTEKSTDDKNIISKYLAQKEKIQKNNPQKPTKKATQKSPSPKKPPLEDITKGDSFKL